MVAEAILPSVRMPQTTQPLALSLWCRATSTEYSRTLVRPYRVEPEDVDYREVKHVERKARRPYIVLSVLQQQLVILLYGTFREES